MTSISLPGSPTSCASWGHDVVAVVERPDLHRATDEALWAGASSESRVIVTQAVADLMRLASQDAAIGKPDPGLILVHHRRFSRGARDIGRLVASLGSMLAAAPADDALAGRIVWLAADAEESDHRQRVPSVAGRSHNGHSMTPGEHTS